MILIPLKYQLDGINAIKIIFKSSWHTHMKHYKPYTVILKTAKNPSYGFCAHILYASTIILIFSGLFLHRISRLLVVNLKWLRIPIVYFL